MRRFAVPVLVFLSVATATAQVQSVGDVSFAVPTGWTYKPSAGFGAVVLNSGKNYWLMGVYGSMPTSGNATTDFNTAWTRIFLGGKEYQGTPLLPYNTISHSVGYPGLWASNSSVNRATYARLYVLEAGKSFIPVAVVSQDGMILNAMENVAYDLIGSVRLSPLKAQPLKTTITMADLAGHWIHGMATGASYYNQQTGQYVGSTSAFYGAGYDIASNGQFSYKMSGMINGGSARDEDSGQVELGGDLIIFKGRNHTVRYRFINCQTSLDGSTVLTLLPENDPLSTMTIMRDGDQWSRPPKR